MAASEIEMPTAPASYEIFALADDGLVCIQNPRVTVFRDAADLINGVYRGICKIDKLRLVVPGSSLGKIHDAHVPEIPQIDRVIGYCESEDDIRCYKQNSAEHISWKVQYCLTRDLRRVLNGEEIRSILYQDGPLDLAALNDVVGEMQQRLAEKEKAAESAPINISTGPVINERCWRCEELVTTRNSCEFCSTPTPPGTSPQNDRSIDDSIVVNGIQYPPANSDSN